MQICTRLRWRKALVKSDGSWSKGLTPYEGRIKVVWAPGWNLARDPFYIYETVVNREKVNERTEVFVLLKQKKLEQKKRTVN